MTIDNLWQFYNADVVTVCLRILPQTLWVYNNKKFIIIDTPITKRQTRFWFLMDRFCSNINFNDIALNVLHAVTQFSPNYLDRVGMNPEEVNLSKMVTFVA